MTECRMILKIIKRPHTMKTTYTSKKRTSKFVNALAGKSAEALVALKQKVAGIRVLLFLFLLLAASTAGAQAFIRFNMTQGRVTVPAGSIFTNSTVLTNSVNLGSGAASANFDVSGLPAGAGYVLTDTNGNALLSTTMDTNLWLTVNTANIPEGLYNFRLNAGGFDTNGLPVTNSIVLVLQAAHIWNGSLNASNAWSDPASWLGGVPGASDDVVFADQGAQTNNFANTTGQSFTNSFVTVNTTVASLRFAQTGYTNSIATNPPPIFHHVQIAPATTLTITGTNGFSMMRDYFDDASAGLNNMNVTIDGGSGSKLIISNQTAFVTSFVGGSLIPTLNMSNLETLVVKVSRIGIGDYQLYPNYRDLNAGLNAGRDTNQYSPRPRQMSANIYLAKTNLITASYKDPQNYTNDFTRSYPFTFFNNEQSGVGSGSSPAQVSLLGLTNIFLLDGVCFYGANGNGTVRFGPSNGVALFRGTNGTSGLSIFTVSDDGGTNEASSNLKGVVDFSANNGLVDLLVTNLYLSRDRELINTNQTPNVQSDLTIGRGSVVANTAILGYQEHTKPDWTVIGGGQAYLDYCQGRLVVTNGGTFKVLGTMTLGYTADTNNPGDAEQYGTYGQVTIYSNSVIAANNIVCDGGLNFYDSGLNLPGSTPRNNTITINQGGNLIVSNAIGGINYAGSQYPSFANQGSPGLPVDTFTMGQGSTLTLFVTGGKTNVYVRRFVSTGSTPGTIKISSLTGVTVFPTNVQLIAYSSPSAPSLQADMSAIGGNVQGYILNDNVGQTINLFLTTNAPKTLTWVGNVNNNWDLTTKNWIPTGGGVATNFSMGDIVNFDDTSAVTNINVVGALVANQAANGVVITNSFRQYAFSPDGGGGAIAGTAKILKQGTNIVTFGLSESGPISVTAGEVDVANSGVLGTTTLSSNTVLQVFSGGAVGSLTSTGLVVTVANGGSIGGVVLVNSSLINDGTISVGSGAFTLNNNSVVTNNSDGIINLGTATGGGAGGYEVFAGSTLANFGAITAPGGRLLIDGLYFGTGSFSDPINGANSSGLARVQMDSVFGAMISPGVTVSNSIGSLYINGRLDFHQSSPNNNVGSFLVELNSGGTVYDYITCTKWNNTGCYWIMTNLDNSPFSSGQSFQILQNANGLNVPNVVDTPSLFPFMQPTVPGPGLQWNLSQIQAFGIISITNSSMIWNGAGDGVWATNSASANNWKSGQFYGDNQGAIFDESASGPATTITLNSPVAPAGIPLVTNAAAGTVNTFFTNTPTFSPGIVVSNATKHYTFVASTQTNRITGMTSIYKTGPGTLTLLTSNDFTGGMVVDGGTLEVTNSAALGVAPASQTPAYNQVLIDNNATIRWFGGVTNTSFGRFITINQNGATFEVSSNYVVLTLNQNVLGAGALTKTGPGTLLLSQTGDAYAGGTIVNAGTLRLTAVAAGSGGITLASNTTLELTNSLSFTNAMNVTGTGVAINVQGVSTNVSGGAWTGNGTMTITTTNAADLFVFNAALSGFSGTVSFGTSSSTFRFNNSTNNSSSKSLGSTTATFDLGTGAAVLNNFIGAGLTYDLGALSGGANTVLTGRATNSALSIAATTYSIGAKGVDSTFAGTISNGFDTVSVIKVGAGKLLLNGNSIYTGSTTVSNGALGGIGSIASPLTVTAGGTLSPGAPIGTFTVSNNVTLGGTVLMELNQSSSPANDMLAVTGTITGGGALVVTNVGPNIVNGSKFQLFNKAVTGLTVTLPTGGGSYNWANNITVDGSITLTSGGSSVNPNPTSIMTGVTNGVLTLSWPADHTGWTLQVQTNPLSVGLFTNWFIVPGSSSTNSVSMPIDANNGSVFYRLTLP